MGLLSVLLLFSALWEPALDSENLIQRSRGNDSFEVCVAPSIMHTLQILGFIPPYPPDCDTAATSPRAVGLWCLVLAGAAAFAPRLQGSLLKLFSLLGGTGYVLPEPVPQDCFSCCHQVLSALCMWETPERGRSWLHYCCYGRIWRAGTWAHLLFLLAFVCSFSQGGKLYFCHCFFWKYILFSVCHASQSVCVFLQELQLWEVLWQSRWLV